MKRHWMFRVSFPQDTDKVLWYKAGDKEVNKWRVSGAGKVEKVLVLK